MATKQFIDIHSHILPGVDDGSSSMEETMEMLRIAGNEGITTMIATPHYAAGSKNMDMEQLVGIKNKVQETAKELELNLDILLGNEIYYSESVLEDVLSGKVMTLADSHYVLIEFGVREYFKTIYHGLQEFVLAGYAPVLAHVERYQCLIKREDLMEELIKLGSYIQMNSFSLSGGFWNTEAAYHRKLVNKGLIHLIGTDCHDAKRRPPCIESAYKAVRKHMSDIQIQQIFVEHPRKILENKYI